jgi:hypothetical protein
MHLKLSDVAVDLIDKAKDWPRRVGSTLFVAQQHPNEDESLRYLSSASELFSWIQERLIVQWFKADCLNTVAGVFGTPITKEDLYIYLCNHAKEYASVESWPHHTPFPSTYYLDRKLPDPDPKLLDELGEHLNWQTPLDRDLSYGVGKTETAKLFCSLWGGSVELNDNDSWDKIQKALMNDDQIGRRCILIDNIKTHLSHSGLESLITTSEASGHVMYVGYRKVPNYFTIYLTANTPRLSRDLVDRAVMAQIGPHSHASHWKDWAVSFIKHKQKTFIATCLARIREGPKSKIPPGLLDRWSLWQREVLATFPNGPDLAAHYIALRGRYDEESQMAVTLATVFRSIIQTKGFPDPDTVQLRLPKMEVADALKENGIFQVRLSPLQIEKRVVPYLTMPPLRPVKDAGDGEWVWTGVKYQPPTPKPEGSSSA